MNKVRLGLIVLVCMSTKVLAGNLEPPAGPGEEASAMYSIEAVYQRLLHGTPGVKWSGGFREPTAPPGSTGHDLNEVMAKAPSLDNTNGVTTEKVPTSQTFWGLTSNEWGTQIGTGTRTLSTNTAEVQAGYYAATNLTEVDTDLVTNNIRVDVNIFGVTGTVYECSVPKTGLTDSYGTNDDGFLEKGIAWPDPRFSTNALEPEVVIDNLTGLMWTKNANLWGTTNWWAALTNCNEHTVYGYDDWRLPNVRELFSLIDFGQRAPALPSGYPFTGVKYGFSLEYYWTGTTTLKDTGNAWKVRMYDGNTIYDGKATLHYIWPVRGP